MKPYSLEWWLIMLQKAVIRKTWAGEKYARWGVGREDVEKYRNLVYWIRDRILANVYYYKRYE